MALPRGAMGLSAVCDCGISLSYSVSIFYYFDIYFLWPTSPIMLHVHTETQCHLPFGSREDYLMNMGMVAILVK